MDAQADHLMEQARRKGTVCYCSEYALQQAPAATALEGLEKEYAGLVAHHWLEQGGRSDVRLLFYWKDRPAFEAARSRLEERLSLGGPGFEGWVRQLWAERLPLLTRFRRRLGRELTEHWGRNLLALAGAWTAVFLPLYYTTCAPPDITARVDLSRDLIADERFPGRVWILNNRDYPARLELVELKAELAATPPETVPLTFQALDERLSGRAERELAISGRLSKAGTYELVGAVNAVSGLFRTQREVPLKREIQVWPVLPEEVFEVVPQEDRRSAVLKGVVLIGPAASHGLDCDVSAFPPLAAAGAKAEEVRFGDLRFRGVATWPEDTIDRDPDGSWAGTHRSWRTPHLADCTEQRFSLELESDRARDWGELVVEFECRTRTEA